MITNDVIELIESSKLNETTYILSQTYNATLVYFYCHAQEQYQTNISSAELGCWTIDTSRKILFVTFCVMRLKKLIIFQR